MGTGNVSRRAILKDSLRVAAAGAAAGAVAGAWPESATRVRGEDGGRPTVTVLLDETIGTINPAIYGQFLEHIGGVIYDGVWVGPDSKIANTNGIRQSILDHVKRLGPTVVRWPGGCFADGYHWLDGIGARSKRPRRYGRWRDDTEGNAFGTHEFMEFCRLGNVQPYFAANVGTGTAEEFQAWVEYCNAPAGKTTRADQRVSNGDEKPFGVRYWGVGNESWGCGGKFTPEDYCTEYRKFTDHLPSYGTPLSLIAAGPSSNDLNWTRRFFKKWLDFARAPLNAWAAHYYCGTTGHALKFNRDQWYEMLFKRSAISTLIEEQWAAMGEFDPQHKVKLILDEWGCWHPPGTEVNPQHLYGQMSCLRDALVAALTLDIFNRNAEKVMMSNVAQMVNCLQSLFLADGDRFVATPNFHVYEMYRPHQNATAVRIDVRAEEVAFKTAAGPARLARVAGSASRRADRLTLTLVHTHADTPAEVTIALRNGRAKAVRATVLTDTDLSAHNTFERPDAVVPKSLETSFSGPSFVYTLPPASVTRLDITMG